MIAAPPLPLKVAGKVKLLAGTPKLPSFAQSLLLELLELDELEKELETLLRLDDVELEDELLTLEDEEFEDELLKLDREEFEDELLTLDNEELEERLLTLDCEELEDELLTLDDEDFEDELLTLEDEEFEEELVTLTDEAFKDELLTLDDDVVEEDVLDAALEAKMLVADDATLAIIELLELEVGAMLDARLEDDELLAVEDALLGVVVVDGVKPESPLPPPPPPHAVNTTIKMTGVSGLIR